MRRFEERQHLSESAMSISNRNRTMTGLKFLFRVTLRRLDLVNEIYHLRETATTAQSDEPGRGQVPAPNPYPDVSRFASVVGSKKVAFCQVGLTQIRCPGAISWSLSKSTTRRSFP